MSLTRKIDLAAGNVVLRYDGVTAFSEWEATMDALLADPRFQPGMCMLSDRTGSTDVMTPLYVHNVVTYMERHARELHGCGWAVVTQPGADWGMSRMGALLTSEMPIEMHPFLSVAEARAWLISRRQARAARREAESC